MRLIPKKSNNGDVFKGFTLYDIAYVVCVIIVCVGIALTNIPIKWWLVIAIATICSTLLIKMDEIRLYRYLINAISYVFVNKNYNKNAVKDKSNTSALMSYIDVKDDMILFPKYYAKVLEIDNIQFTLLTEEEQNRYIAGFAKVFRKNNKNLMLQLVKIERPIIYDKILQDIERRITSEKSEARIKILQLIKEQYTKQNNDEKVYCARFYLVMQATTKNSVQELADSLLDTLKLSELDGKMLNTIEIAQFLKYQHGYDFDEREAEKINVDELWKWTLPDSIEIGLDEIKVNGVDTRTYGVTDYPIEAINGWGAELFSMPHTKVVMNIGYVNKKKAIRNLDRQVMDLQTKQNGTDRISELARAGDAQDTLVDAATELQRNEVLSKVSVYVTQYFREDAPINVTENIETLGFNLSKMKAQSIVAYTSSGINSADLCKQTHFDMTTDTIAACFPFIFPVMNEIGGVPIGENENGVPVTIDFFTRKSRDNSNMAIVGKSGSGKSYFIKYLLALLYGYGCNLVVVDPMNEYIKFFNSIGGTVIDLADGKCIINPFEVMDSNKDGYMLLTDHLLFLEKFFSLIFDGMSYDELQLLQNVVSDMYSRKGMSDKVLLSKIKSNGYFTFTQVLKRVRFLQGLSAKNAEKGKESQEATEEQYRSVAMHLEKCVSGRYGKLWNGVTNIDLKHDAVLFECQNLLNADNNTLASAQLSLLARYLNKTISNNYASIKQNKEYRRVAIVFDENHNFISPKMPIALDCERVLAKQCRKCMCLFATATQSITDYVANENIAISARALISESDYHMLLKASAAHMDDIRKVYQNIGLNDYEEEALKTNPRGTGLMMCGSYNRFNLSIVVPKQIAAMYEYDVIIQNE